MEMRNRHDENDKPDAPLLQTHFAPWRSQLRQRAGEPVVCQHSHPQQAVKIRSTSCAIPIYLTSLSSGRRR
jgi:hypothetical protein